MGISLLCPFTSVARTKLPNLKFNFVTGGSGVLLKRMEAEMTAPQADLFWSSSANTLGAFKPLFEPYRSPEAASIPAALSEPGNLWTAKVFALNENEAAARRKVFLEEWAAAVAAKT